ncbi:hypothetical protein [Blastococcus haudaquaticus]|uniref:Uncharacterized protein n=1 Tax=Blastococcus haudaquaticus TaxID=1938745 RepID=A0A286GXT1_9ACTN|nr:hypothetical protein [Blastococcus haudaquaticus]SOE00347.1 hypothetical protein SAMN06272739_2546 [Blastococcus haudaquaticus]
MSQHQGRHRIRREEPTREGVRERVVPALWGANGTLVAAAVVTLLVGGAEPRDVLADPPTFGPSETGPRGSGGDSGGDAGGDAGIVPVASEVPEGGGMGRSWPGAGWSALWADSSTPGSFAALCDGLTSVRLQPASAATAAWVAGPVSGQPASGVPAPAGAPPATGAAPAGAPPASSGGSTGSTGSSPTAPTVPQSGTPVVTAPEPVTSTIDPVVDAAEPVVETVTDPVVEVAQPVVEAAQPVVEAAEPVVETVTEPVVDAVEPVTEPVTAPVEKVLPAPVTQTVEELPVVGGLVG